MQDGNSLCPDGDGGDTNVQTGKIWLSCTFKISSLDVLCTSI